MKPTRKVLCLDFDGVICNSIDECLLVAYNSYMKFENRHSEQVLIIDDIMKNIYHRFHQHRYLVRPAKDYWVLLDLVLGNQHISKEEFQLKKINNEDRLNSFETIFFKTRKEFQINNFESWIKMNRLYDNFLDGWREVSSVFDVYIVTNKNKNSVETILKYNKISILDDHIY
ncbi:MAG: hypothetical protein GY756_21625, partial [bacterium]|nr:hypothetical protein [bacterium]